MRSVHGNLQKENHTGNSNRGIKVDDRVPDKGGGAEGVLGRKRREGWWALGEQGGQKLTTPVRGNQKKRNQGGSTQ